MPRPFRFLADAREVATIRQLTETARRAEAIGIDTLVVPDHLIQQLAPVPTMAAIAAVSDRLRIAAFVLNNDLRHPAVLAQELASLDVLSEGRLDVAIGAGWNRAEYEAIGLAFDPTPVRQARLAEAVAVLKGCFADGPFSFAGEHYTITDYDAQPKPAQRPHPPFLIGGGGRRTLTLAAREAQIVGLAPRILPNRAPDPRSVTFDGHAREDRLGARGVRRALRRARAERLPVDDRHQHHRRAARARPARSPSGCTSAAASRSPPRSCSTRRTSSSNTVDGFVEKLRRHRDELGISSIMVGGLGELDPVVERLAGT